MENHFSFQLSVDGEFYDEYDCEEAAQMAAFAMKNIGHKVEIWYNPPSPA